MKKVLSKIMRKVAKLLPLLDNIAKKNAAILSANEDMIEKEQAYLSLKLASGGNGHKVEVARLQWRAAVRAYVNKSGYFKTALLAKRTTADEVTGMFDGLNDKLQTVVDQVRELGPALEELSLRVVSLALSIYIRVLERCWTAGNSH